jgi:hypothetical protein
MEKHRKKLNREYILWRISDWKNRLENLFNDIKLWTNIFEKIEIKESMIPQAREEFLQMFNIDPDSIPVMAILFSKNRVSFVPMGLWVIGSNGRVNINTNKNQYILFDLGGKNGEPSQWTIVNPSKRKERIIFDKPILTKIIEDEALFT